MRYHFIAIGGSAMHNLAIALHKKGAQVSGSDDEIFDPAKSNLNKYGLLPKELGWHRNRISTELDAVVLGMHAKKDNPELLRAQELGIKIYSYPEFLYEQTKNKKRIVIGGSHGKTTTTAMVMHVLKHLGFTFDYMVGAKIYGFDTMVNLQEDAEYAVFEGDEYLTSPIDPRPKFHLYKPHIALITGIAWDHINVFPTLDIYHKQFELFIQQVQQGGKLIYFSGDIVLERLVKKCPANVKCISYRSVPHETIDSRTSINYHNISYPLNVFGEHNMQNMAGAWEVCKAIGVSDEQFLNSISSFAGAQKRLQLLAENKHSKVYLDFAHSPSKLEATIAAVKTQFPKKKLVACMELHTYSSLSQNFLNQYEGTMNPADTAIVYFSKHAIELKKLKAIEPEMVAAGFKKEGLVVYNNQEALKNAINFMELNNCILLLLSSGNFSGIDLKKWAKELMSKANKA